VFSRIRGRWARVKGRDFAAIHRSVCASRGRPAASSVYMSVCLCVCVCTYICICVCVFVCVCVYKPCRGWRVSANPVSLSSRLLEK
jgi:hypothetical protein